MGVVVLLYGRRMFFWFLHSAEVLFFFLFCLWPPPFDARLTNCPVIRWNGPVPKRSFAIVPFPSLVDTQARQFRTEKFLIGIRDDCYYSWLLMDRVLMREIHDEWGASLFLFTSGGVLLMSTFICRLEIYFLQFFPFSWGLLLLLLVSNSSWVVVVPRNRLTSTKKPVVSTSLGLGYFLHHPKFCLLPIRIKWNKMHWRKEPSLFYPATTVAVAWGRVRVCRIDTGYDIKRPTRNSNRKRMEWEKRESLPPPPPSPSLPTTPFIYLIVIIIARPANVRYLNVTSKPEKERKIIYLLLLLPLHSRSLQVSVAQTYKAKLCAFVTSDAPLYSITFKRNGWLARVPSDVFRFDFLFCLFWICMWRLSRWSKTVCLVTNLRRCAFHSTAARIVALCCTWSTPPGSSWTNDSRHRHRCQGYAPFTSARRILSRRWSILSKRRDKGTTDLRSNLFCIFFFDFIALFFLLGGYQDFLSFIFLSWMLFVTLPAIGRIGGRWETRGVRCGEKERVE